MTPEDLHIQTLLGRLLCACQRLPDFGGSLWSRGQAKIEEKYHCEIWLESFVPSDISEVDISEEPVTIEVTDGP